MSLERNEKGMIGFCLLAVIFGPIVELFMIGREVYQWKHYNLPKFEWDDILRYTLFIFVGSMIHWFLIEQIFF